MCLWEGQIKLGGFKRRNSNFDKFCALKETLSLNKHSSVFWVMISFFKKKLGKEIVLFLARHYFFTNLEKEEFLFPTRLVKSSETEPFWEL